MSIRIGFLMLLLAASLAGGCDFHTPPAFGQSEPKVRDDVRAHALAHGKANVIIKMTAGDLNKRFKGLISQLAGTNYKIQGSIPTFYQVMVEVEYRALDALERSADVEDVSLNVGGIVPF